MRTFTPLTWAPAPTCAVVNAPAASSSSLNAHDLGVCFTLEVGLQVVAEALGWNIHY
ncbi:hypothetical protein ABZ920_01380 [Streptomyces sp. NPDC046831]|uniref:hypothetical protein n=1 Tax=Streptomyces sp. NPDC046831 TaxID=3154805 RepID=UPI0033EEB7A8